MKKISLTVFLFIAVIQLSATLPLKQEKMITVTEKNILSQFKALPDASINFQKVSDHYKQFPDRWNSAFAFLQNNDLLALPLGRIDINDDVYVSVSEYTTKNPEDALYESHKEYIDLQYIITGNEYIGLTNDLTIPVKTAYDAKKDIAFYNYDGGKMLLATPEKYFIFFPEDVHRPCIKVETQSIVRKIVIKIKL